jgi:ribosomal protein S18 acetylase RimI-like enzyme
VFRISLATEEDIDDIVLLRDNAVEWLRSMQSDQWQKPWPSAEGAGARLRQSIDKRTTWLVRLSADAAATFVIDEYSDPHLWTEFEQSERALYIHRFIVHRDYSGIGLGTKLMALIEAMAAHGGYRWLRVDVWTTNHGLQKYYLGKGFKHVRTIESDYPSGALFQHEVRKRTH